MNIKWTGLQHVTLMYKEQLVTLDTVQRKRWEYWTGQEIETDVLPW